MVDTIFKYNEGVFIHTMSSMKGAFIIILVSAGLVTAVGITLVLVNDGDTTVETLDSDGWDTEDQVGFTIFLYGLIFGCPSAMCIGAAIMNAGIVNKQKRVAGEK